MSFVTKVQNIYDARHQAEWAADLRTDILLRGRSEKKAGFRRRIWLSW